MVGNVNIVDFKRELSNVFEVVTPAKLSSAGGSKTVKEAKLLGVFLLHKAGYSNDEIASQFGYTNSKSISVAYSHAVENYKYEPSFEKKVHEIAQKFHIELE